MGIISALRATLKEQIAAFRSDSSNTRVGIYGVPNVGKTTFINRIARDYGGGEVGVASGIPHETNTTQSLEEIPIRNEEGEEIVIDFVDTPGIESTVDKSEFSEWDITGDDALRRENQAAQGVSSAVEAMEIVDAVIIMFDATVDPENKSVRRIVSLAEEKRLPILVLANKIDKDGADINRIRDSYPHHEVTPLSALEGWNMNEVYLKMAEYFDET